MRHDGCREQTDLVRKRHGRLLLSRRSVFRRPTGRATGYVLFLAVCSFGCLFGLGCRGPQKPIMRPARHSIRSDQLLVLSDFRLPAEHPLIEDLMQLRKQVSKSLDLPADGDEVVVYLFGNETQYRQYLGATYPGLPPRRAYFVGTPKELAVYTFWGDRIQEDLRHEYTHGLLHAVLKTVPLWLDEGLAEYFEVAGPNLGTVNTDYAYRLTSLLANGWQPDMNRLERFEEFSQMQRIDYQESWAWVHYMLHTTPEAKSALLSYLRDLRTQSQPIPLSVRLEQDHPQVTVRFLNYLASLNTASLLSQKPKKEWQPSHLTTEISEPPSHGTSQQ